MYSYLVNFFELSTIYCTFNLAFLYIGKGITCIQNQFSTTPIIKCILKYSLYNVYATYL